MKRLTLLISTFYILIPLHLFAQDQVNDLRKTTFYLVRHAEKDTGYDPQLKQTGYEHAGDLYRAIKDKKIEKVFVSQYRRTRLTADSLVFYKGIDTVHYKADTFADDLFSKIAAFQGKLGAVLIIGHSNTIPHIIRRLGVTGFQLNEIPDYEYDNLFIVKKGENNPVLIQKKFGKISKPEKRATMKPLE